MSMIHGSIEKNLENIKEIDKMKSATINRLRVENEKLKSEVYKDEELQRLKKEIADIRETEKYSFQISLEEHQKIEEWKQKHIKEKHWDKHLNAPQSSGTIGGRFTYHFIPTSIGTIGEIECGCGEKFCFAELF